MLKDEDEIREKMYQVVDNLLSNVDESQEVLFDGHNFVVENLFFACTVVGMREEGVIEAPLYFCTSSSKIFQRGLLHLLLSMMDDGVVTVD